MKVAMISSRKQKTRSAVSASPWLLLVHQLPPKPAYFRVKIWRRLQGIGAVSLKNSVYVLPPGEQSPEDLQWLLREIERGGGDGVICEAHIVDGMSDQQVRGLFDAARDADYAEIARELRKLGILAKRGGATRRKDAPPLRAQVAKLRRHLAEISAIDFFGATGRLTVEALLTEIATQLAEPPSAPEEAAIAKTVSGDLTGKTWVTRRDVHVDRIACAWLIRRFIDPAARFKFVAAKNYGAKRGELRFDMFEAEFTHEGDRCTFEVMLERIGLDDAALRAIAEIVHDIDLKDGKFAREQVAGIAHVIAGICMTQAEDPARIERASALLDDTYAYFKRRRRR
jgi:hypothetical protein